jgi:hypothetical protein
MGHRQTVFYLLLLSQAQVHKVTMFYTYAEPMHKAEKPASQSILKKQIHRSNMCLALQHLGTLPTYLTMKRKKIVNTMLTSKCQHCIIN